MGFYCNKPNFASRDVEKMTSSQSGDEKAITSLWNISKVDTIGAKISVRLNKMSAL